MSAIYAVLSQPNRSSVVRKVLIALTVLSVASGMFSRNVNAQTATEKPDRWEFRASSGALVPTGSARTIVKDAALSTAQLSYLVRPSFAITGTLGWARSRDRLSEGQPKLDAFLYDLGAEVRLKEVFGNTPWALASFVGGGAGAQSYNYRSLDMSATHNVAGYATMGAEGGVRRVRIRLEVRDYVSGFKPLSGVGESRTHNDVVVIAAIRIAKSQTR